MGITNRFTNKELIPASKARDAHAQNLVANKVFLLPIAKVFVPRLAFYTLLKMPDVFRLYVIVAELQVRVTVHHYCRRRKNQQMTQV